MNLGFQISLRFTLDPPPYPPMTPRFQAALRFVLDHETVFAKGHWGDYAFATWEKNGNDPGGLTKFGIDQRSHPSTNIKTLTLEQAEAIYWYEYWIPAGAEHMPPGFGEVLFDTRVNGGDGPKMLQAALNKLGANLKVDGVLGPKSVAAMTQYGKAGLTAFIDARQARYNTLARQKRFAGFLKGWTARMNDLRRWLLMPAHV